ncbi:unnamed protein product [Trichobilharzia szidati]|nr:unnamed protein product [Trichobilharzia szidati]
MFKKFLASITDYIIGKYVENFNGENLSYGLLNGNITLSNLTLKKDTLNSLFNIPLTLQSGTVGNVSIFVPYTHPWSQAWQLSLENVDLIAYASADDLWDKLNPNNSPSDSQTSSIRNETSKDSLVNNESGQQSQRDNLSPTETSIHGKYSLDKMEKKWFQTINGVVLSDTAAIAELVAMDNRGDNSSWWSYISSVGYGIIRSLQIEIRQVRISLIDPNSSSTMGGNNSSESGGEHTFFHDDCPSFGIFTITLEHLTMETTDSCWKRTTSTSEEPVEYKLINVRGLNITWHPDISKSSIHSIDCTIDEKATEEASSEAEELSNQNILHILPPCHLTGRLKRKQTNISMNSTTNNSNTITPSTNSTLLTGPLINRKYQSEYHSSEAQIELTVNLSQLDIQISQELCRSLLHLSEVLKCQYERTEQLKRRPCSSSTTVKRYADWWRYAAGEVHPPLRLYLNSTFRHVTLSSLANEAKLNIIYVKAYTAYLIKGLSSSSSSGETLTSTSTKCLITIDQVSVICKSLNYTPEMDSERLKHDEIWSIQRIAILRLIAMRRATVILHKLLKCDKNVKHGSKRSSVDSGQSSATPLPFPPPPASSVVDSTSTSTSTASTTTTPNQSYYNSWWRYSSWLGLTTSSFFSSNTTTTTVNNVDSSITDQTADEIQKQQQDEEEGGESADDSSFNHSTSSSPPTSSTSIIIADTIFELLDEFAEHTNNNIDYTSINYPVFLQFICTIDGCSLRLIDSQQEEEAMHAYMVHPAFVSISGQQMNFSLAIRPKCNSYRISTYIQSFTVHDERWSSAQQSNSSSSSSHERDSSSQLTTPLFPVVVYPRYHHGYHLESDMTTAATTVIADDAQERRVFSLIYEVNPVKINADYLLEIHTDPLQVICQPELLRHIINFIKSAVHSSKPSKQSRLNHSVKEGISINLSSLIKDTDATADTTDNNDTSSIGGGCGGSKNIPIPKKSITFTSSSSAAAGASSVKSRNRWAINFDLAAPRILFPNRYNIYNEEEQEKKADTLMSTSLSMCTTCVLCDFGHLRVTNWPEVQIRSMRQKKCNNVVLSGEMNSMQQRSGVLDNLNKLENEKFLAAESLDAATAAGGDDDDDDYDDADEYKTPCSTPGELSDNDDNENNNNNNNIEDGSGDVDKVEQSSQRQNEPPIGNHGKGNEAEKSLPADNAYTSYMINIDNIRVLVGSFHMLETLGLWSQFNSAQISTELQDEKEKPPLHPTSLTSSDASHSVLRMSKSALVSRLCLINPFDLRLLISRRVPTLQHISKLPSSSSSYSTSTAHLPYLWISLSQPSCVIQLSNTKISDFFSCLEACQRQWDQSHPSQQHSQSCSNIHQMNFTTSTPSIYKSIHDNSQQATTTTTTKSCRSSNHLINHQHVEKYSIKSIISSNSQRIQIIATYSIQSFIIQFESKDRPLAECRLDGAVFNWSVYRDCQADYSVQFKLGSISIVDAVSNVGGLYDVILNSDKVKRTDAIDSMITENNNQNDTSHNYDDGGGRTSVVFNSRLPFSLWKKYSSPLPDHINPLDEFKPFNSQIEQSDTFLMACLTWCPSSSGSSKLYRTNKTTAVDSIGSYFIELSMGYLKITGNPITMKIINEFITDLNLSLKDHYYSRNQLTSSDHHRHHHHRLDEESSSSQSSFSHQYFPYDSFAEEADDTSLSPFIDYNWQISLANLDILLINHPVDSNNNNNNSNEYNSLTGSVKEIVQMTFSNLRLELQTSGLLNSLSVKLKTFQLHPLCNSQIQSDQYLFGSIFSPVSFSTTAEQHSDLMHINVQWYTQHNSYPPVEIQQPQIQITLSNLVYIHSHSDVLEIIQWFQCIIPYLRLNKTVIQSSRNAHIDSDSGNEISSRLDKLLLLLSSLSVQFSMKINNSIILIPSSFNPCAHFSLVGFKQIQINHNLLNSMFNYSNSNDNKSVSFSIEQFSIMHYVNEAGKVADQFLLRSSPPMERKKLFHLNFRLLYEFWCQQMVWCNDPLKYELCHRVIVFPMDFSVYINYIKLNPARKSYSSSSPSNWWLQTVRFNFSDLSFMQTAKLNQFTKYHHVVVVVPENNDEMNAPPPSTNRSAEGVTCSHPCVNLLLFSEPITTQLTVVIYIHTMRFNLTKMNCDLVKDLFDSYLLKQFEENQSDGVNNEEALQTDQPAAIQQPSYSDLNSIPIGLNSIQCGSLEFGIRVNCSQIHILMLGDLDITPIPLASLTIESLEASSSSVHISKGGGGGGITLPTCLQLNVGGAYLQNRLPPSKHDYDKEKGKERKTSTTQRGGGIKKQQQQFLLVCKDFSSAEGSYGHTHKDNKYLRRKRINSCSTEDYDKIYYTEGNWCSGNHSTCGKDYLSNVWNHDDNDIVGLLHQVSPISVRVILLSDQHESFCQTKYFVKLSMDTLDFRLLSEPWVLLLDFLNLCDDDKEEALKKTVGKLNQNTIPSCYSNSAPAATKSIPIPINNDPKLCLLLDISSVNCIVTEPSKTAEESLSNSDSPDKVQSLLTCVNLDTDLAVLSSSGIKLQVSYTPGVDATTATAASYRSVDVGGEHRDDINDGDDDDDFLTNSCLQMEGHMYSIKLIALPRQYASLYGVRLMSAPTQSLPLSVDSVMNNTQLPFLVFQFNKAKKLSSSPPPPPPATTTSTNRCINSNDKILKQASVNHNANLRIHLSGVSYIHTHSFLMSVINTLQNAIEQYTSLKQTRYCVKGLQMPTTVDITALSCLHLNISAHRPLNLIIPVCCTSSKVLIINMNGMKIDNTFLWNNTIGGGGGGDTVGVNSGSMETLQSTSSHTNGNNNNDNNNVPRGDNRYFYSNIRSLNKSNSTGLLECSNFNTQDSTPQQHLLIDQISMDLYEVSLYCAERIDTFSDDVMLDSGVNNPPVRFPTYSFIPVNNQFEYTTSEEFGPCSILSRPISCLNLSLERNLTSSSVHELPDIKLTGQLTDCQVYMNTYAYRLIRGILSQNFGENSISSSSTTKSFVNDVCWTKFALDISLNSIQINLFNCSMLPVHLNLANNNTDNHKQFGIINLSDGILSFKYFSNQSTMIQLQCFDINLVEFHEDSTTTVFQLSIRRLNTLLKTTTIKKDDEKSNFTSGIFTVLGLVDLS